MSKYARKLTKEDLIKAGIKDIYYNTDDSKYHIITKNDTEIGLHRNKQNYLNFNIYDLDDEGQYIKKPIKRRFKDCKKISDTYIYKTKTLPLHRAIWAWFKGEVPEGMIVDHIDNKHETHYDNRPENLQLLTPAQNLAKEKSTFSEWKLKCDLSKPLEHYENRLNSFLEAYEKEKDENSSYTKKARNIKNQIYQYRAKIRYLKACEEYMPTIKA